MCELLGKIGLCLVYLLTNMSMMPAHLLKFAIHESEKWCFSCGETEIRDNMREIAIMLQRKKKRRVGDIVVMNLY